MLVKQLEEKGLMTDFGRSKIAEAKKNGQWDAPKSPSITEDQIAHLSELLKEYEPAHTNFVAMSSSVKKTYTRAYLDAKTESGREKRIAWMVDRLNKNLKPMWEPSFTHIKTTIQAKIERINWSSSYSTFSPPKNLTLPFLLYYDMR